MQLGLCKAVCYIGNFTALLDCDLSLTDAVAIAGATDFILSTIPVIFLWNIQIKLQVKLGIAGIMMLGFSYGPRAPRSMKLADHTCPYTEAGLLRLHVQS